MFRGNKAPPFAGPCSTFATTVPALTADSAETADAIVEQGGLCEGQSLASGQTAGHTMGPEGPRGRGTSYAMILLLITLYRYYIASLYQVLVTLLIERDTIHADDVQAVVYTLASVLTGLLDPCQRKRKNPLKR